MKTTTRLGGWLALASVMMLASATYATDNSWTNTGNGLWESAGSWSAGAPSNDFSWLYITNANTKTVTLKPATPV